MWFPWQPGEGWALGIRSSSALHRPSPLRRLALPQPHRSLYAPSQPPPRPLNLPFPFLSLPTIPCASPTPSPPSPPSLVRRREDQTCTQPALTLDSYADILIEALWTQMLTAWTPTPPPHPLILTPTPSPPPHCTRSGLSWEANACGHSAAMCHWPCCTGECMWAHNTEEHGRLLGNNGKNENWWDYSCKLQDRPISQETVKHLVYLVKGYSGSKLKRPMITVASICTKATGKHPASRNKIKPKTTKHLTFCFYKRCNKSGVEEEIRYFI